MYVKRMTVGTHQRRGSTQAPLYYKPKYMVPPNGWTSGAHTIVNVVNKRENYTTSG